MPTVDRSLIAVVLVAALLRLAWVVTVPTAPVSDYVAYDRFAWHVATGQGYSSGANPSSDYAPGYTLFLAGIYWLFGWSHLAAKLANVLAGALVVALAHRCGRLLWGGRAGLAAAWVVACFPSLVLYAGLLASENLYVPLLLGALCLMLSGRGWRAAALCGALLAYGVLTRPVSEALPLLAPALPWLRGWPWRRALRFAAVCWLCVALVLAPWVVRNARIYHTFVLVTTTLGGNLFDGEPAARDEVRTAFAREDLPTDDRWMARDAIEGVPAPPDVALREDRLATAVVLRWDREHPVLFVGHSLRRLAQIYLLGLDTSALHAVWDWRAAEVLGLSAPTPPDPSQARERPPAPPSPAAVLVLGGLAATYYLAVLLLAAAGAARAAWRCWAARRCSPALAPLLVIGYFALVHAVVQGADNYHVPTLPLLALYAAVALPRLATWRAGADAPTPTRRCATDDGR